MEITFHGHKARLAGCPLQKGDYAPEVMLINKTLKGEIIGGAKDYVQIISTLPSLDTGVCATEAREFNKRAASLKGAKIFVVSVDTPFAQGRFCSTEGISNLEVLSDFADKDFGKTYGLILRTSPIKGALTRAVYVVNKEGSIVYSEICKETTDEPDYEAAIAAATKATHGEGCGCK